MAPHYELNSGNHIPAIGFGTWHIMPDDLAQRNVEAALASGYRLIDTAKIYNNERGIGRAIQASSVPRRDIIVTSKLWNDDQGYDSALKAFENSRTRLGLEYLDLYLIHWPGTTRRFDSWRALRKLYDDGMIKAAGVSNFTVQHLQELRDRSDFIPAVNQIEFNPFIYQHQKELLMYCAQAGIIVEAYSPLRKLAGQEIPQVQTIAVAHGKSPQQIILRWCVQHGTVPLPRTTTPQHMADNLNVFDFRLTDAQMRALDNI